MKVFRQTIYYVLYPIELFLRFWFPYAFRDDPDNPEPQNKVERKKRRESRKELRQRAKDDPNSHQKKHQQSEYRGRPKKEVQSQQEEQRTDAEILAKVQNLKEVGQPKKKKLGLEMVDLSSDLNNEKALAMLQASEPRVTFYWHDDTQHQIAVKFDKNGIKEEYKPRSNKERRQLEPLITPYRVENTDRTHVIPIGYHGSENDQRLLIRFDSHINQVKLKNFEEQASKINKKQPILWFVDIQKQDNDSVKWYASVWDEQGKVILQKMFHDKRKFKWHQRRF
ncbi:hypothetical protein BUZ69_07990 [Staphylococcus saprophyticus]|uniref:hypothetical protein n=1 Tax=Staphylococcus saprophyticus TaxID=29385 RepID=UPI000D1EBF6C|nr:hypothetical protein [Staphylococcus saprophyticus]PTK46096.1 hypothetical protein BUZ69_07990 [Staphylococcus saprophyticus]